MLRRGVESHDRSVRNPAGLCRAARRSVPCGAMDASVRWLNDYLDPPASAEEQGELLTRAGFPLEGSETVAVSDGEDCCQDFEMTSNRGDCVSHIGLAREIAALSGRKLVLPTVTLPQPGDPAAAAISIENRETDLCPLYTARVIKGVTVGPSPAWLADRLLAIGQIPRNNIVDATNFVLFEYGQPTHVFDLAKLKGQTVIIRKAKAKEPFLPIGDGAHQIELDSDDLVIADAERAVAMAGVKGGALTAVTDDTTDILIEAATFAPVGVRTSSRRHNIASDSSYRFERGVHPAHIEAAAERLTALILETAGGTLLDGVVEAGTAIPQSPAVSLRPERARKVLGVEIETAKMVDDLSRLGFAAKVNGDTIDCTVPIHRLDIEREVDLVEEVGRMHGLDTIPLDDTIRIRVAPPQPEQLARRAVSATLVGMGFVESVTHSLVPEDAARLFLPAGADVLRVDDERARSAPILRPSILPSLMRVRVHNQDNGVKQLDLFESAATFWVEKGTHREGVSLALLCDFDAESGLRPLRGAIERLTQLLLGPDAVVAATATDEYAWYRAAAACTVAGEKIGVMGVLREEVVSAFGTDLPLMAAELDLPRLYQQFPPDTEARALAHFPPIERDLTVLTRDDHAWAAIEALTQSKASDLLEATEFVTLFRGKGIEKGMKAVTLRLRFRASDRTLTHDEVDRDVTAIIKALEASGATLRG